MNAKILTFSSRGDTTLLEYDPATADMEEVNKVIAEYEAKTGAQPFDMATGERLEKVTREQNEVLMVHRSPFEAWRYLYVASKSIYDRVPRSDRVEICVRWPAPQAFG